MRGLPPGHCVYCGLEHAATDERCPPLPTLGENLIVEYRRAKAKVLATAAREGRAQPDFTARELAGLYLTIGGTKDARKICNSQLVLVKQVARADGRIDRLRVERMSEARRLLVQALVDNPDNSA